MKQQLLPVLIDIERKFYFCPSSIERCGKPETRRFEGGSR
jgi:hypothetical protein